MSNLIALKQELGKRLKSLRIKRGLTQEELAEKADMTPKTIRFIESGKNWPRIENVVSLAEALEVDPQQLLPTNEEGGEPKLQSSAPISPLTTKMLLRYQINHGNIASPEMRMLLNDLSLCLGMIEGLRESMRMVEEVSSQAEHSELADIIAFLENSPLATHNSVRAFLNLPTPIHNPKAQSS